MPCRRHHHTGLRSRGFAKSKLGDKMHPGREALRLAFRHVLVAVRRHIQAGPHFFDIVGERLPICSCRQ